MVNIMMEPEGSGKTKLLINAINNSVNLTVDRKADGSMTIYVESAGVSQKFLFTPV